MGGKTEMGDLLREIGWSAREMGHRVGCDERTARGWVEYTEDEHGHRLTGRYPPPVILPWLRFIARTITANPPPSWRVRRVRETPAEPGDGLPHQLADEPQSVQSPGDASA